MLAKKELCVTLVIFKLCAWVGKKYVYPGRPKIVKLCKAWFGVSMSQRTLSRVFASMLREDFFGRQRRKVHCPGGFIRSRSSMTFLTWNSLNQVSRLGALSRLARALTDVPKTARNIFQGRRSSGGCGKLASLIGQVFPKGSPSGFNFLNQENLQKGQNFSP